MALIHCKCQQSERNPVPLYYWTTNPIKHEENYVFYRHFAFFGLNFVFAQKFGYIDSEFILSKMPEYAKAQNEIETYSAAWQKEIEDMQRKVDGLYSSIRRSKFY